MANFLGMRACLTFDDIVQFNAPQVAEFQKLSEKFPDSEDSLACETFSAHVRIVEGALTTCYAIAAKMTRRTEDLEEVASVWRAMGRLCDLVFQNLSSLKERFPHCGAPQLYDLALDYKLACDERHTDALAEIACQKIQFPQGLFPDLN